MGDVKLFVCCHKEEAVPQHPLLVPMQVGTALAEREFAGFLHDNTGENISEKNRSYCELTAQYWAWKNCEADYYGFFHYRRYLYPNAGAKRPYRIERQPTEKLLEKFGYGEFEALIRRYDLIVPKGENMYVPVREHYANAPFHHVGDLTLIETIIRERYPAYAAAMAQYLSETVHYFGNIYIMRREVFRNYCGWLFPILEEFDRRADWKSRSIQERRVDGYLAERLLGIYYTKHCGELHALELPRAHFEPGLGRWIQKRTEFFLFPPGTKVRAVVKLCLR